jgi:hypothetical protein
MADLYKSKTLFTNLFSLIFHHYQKQNNMKAITITLYTCGSLMLIATIVGAVDYTQENRKGTIRNLYQEPQPVVEKNDFKSVDFDDYSRGEINRPEPEANENKIADSEETNETTVTKKSTKKTAKQQKVEKSISYRKFSRAPLPAEMIPYENIDTMPVAEKKNWDY